MASKARGGMIRVTLQGGDSEPHRAAKQAQAPVSPGDLCPTWQSWASTHLGQEPSGLRSQRLGPFCRGLVRGDARVLRKTPGGGRTGGRGGARVSLS